MTLTDKIYSDLDLFNKLEDFVFFYGINSCIPFIKRYFKQHKLKYSSQEIEDSINQVYKIKYLLYIETAVHKLRYSPLLFDILKSSFEPSWELINMIKDIVITKRFITKYIIEDMKLYMNTGSI